MNLFVDQSQAKSHLHDWRVGALFMEAGTGKTRVAVEIANETPCDLVVWIGPFQTLWPDDPTVEPITVEIEKWGGFRTPVIYTGVESLKNSDRIYLNLRNRIEQAANPMIIVDESLKIKNSEAKTTKRIMDMSHLSTYKLILNGTPITKSIHDLKPQMDFLSPLILNMSDAEFKNTFCEYKRVTKSFGGRKQYTKEFITGYENIDYLYSLIRHYVYECDLTLSVKQIYSDIPYKLSEEHLDEYTRLKEKYLDDEMLQWKNNNIFLEMTQKMQHTYSCTEDKFTKLDELFTEIDPERTIIFCKYIDSQEECRKRYPKSTVLSYQKNSLGLNLQHLCNTVYFDKNWDYALRIQSGRRTFRTGQEYDCRYWDLTGNVGLERLIDANISKKTSMAEYFKGKTKEEIKAEL
ncbi:MAG TPA: DEAD/DEAH box helicase [Paludibacter sp.]|nr:DEAD/DEAH box helicase [Paludibacter sp.]